MDSPASPLLYSKEEKSPNSPGCSNDAHYNGLHDNKQKLKGEGGDIARQGYGETRWSDEQPPWIVKDTIPDFVRTKRNLFALDRICRSDPEKSAWIPIPTNFHDVVQIFKDYGAMPMFYKIPHVMQFPEFVGYPWKHRRQEIIDAGMFRRTMWEDQGIFYRIVFASYRTGRAPLSAPDYFYISNRDRKSELYYLFRSRTRIQGIGWNSSLETKKPEEHMDWKPFCEYIRSNLPTAEFLFDPQEVWDEMWFARKISETDVKILVREDIVNLVKAAGHEITEKKGWFGKLPWSIADEEVIRRVASAHWIEWRKKSEYDLQRLDPQLIEL
jgi:hypothetical protein